MLRTATLETFMEIAEPAGLIQSFNKADMEMKLTGDRKIFWRSADNPDRLRGPNIGWFWIDEAALCEWKTWLITIGRLRRSPAVGWITTTPQGKRHWLYDLVRDGKVSATRANTASNRFNPEDFVSSVSGHGEPDWIKQELEGEFIDSGGKVFMRNWFQVVDQVPPGQWMGCRSWDCAATIDGGDFTVGTKARRVGDDFYIEHCIDMQVGPSDVDSLIVETARADGTELVVLLEEEGGSSGKRANEHIIRALTGYAVISKRMTGSKLVRAIPMAQLARAGRIKLVRGEWNERWLDQVCDFTGEESNDRYHDDHADSATLSIGFLSEAVPFEWF
jgi:predicted phage terminase large subunit-like protein